MCVKFRSELDCYHLSLFINNDELLSKHTHLDAETMNAIYVACFLHICSHLRN